MSPFSNDMIALLLIHEHENFSEPTNEEKRKRYGEEMPENVFSPKQNKKKQKDKRKKTKKKEKKQKKRKNQEKIEKRKNKRSKINSSQSSRKMVR